jgi:ribose transport system substrate-binding protein
MKILTSFRNYSRPSAKLRTRPRRMLVVVALLASISLLATACSSSTTKAASTTNSQHTVPKSNIKIAIIPGGPNVYFSPWALAAKALSKKLGVTVSYVVPPTPTFQPSVEVSTIDSLVAKGYNAFAIFPDGESAIKPTYERLIKRGIPVFDLAGCTTDPTPALLCYATNVEASAAYETKILDKAIGGHGNIAFLTGLLTDANTALREKGVEETVAATNGKVKLAQVVSNIDSPSAAPPAVESLLASKGSTLNGMLSTDYYPSVAAASILTADPQFRHVLFIGQDNSPTVMNAVQKHYIYGTMYQNSYGQAYVAGTWLYDMLDRGCTINPNGPFTPIPGPTSHFINSGYFFVSQAAVGQYIGKPENIPANTAKVLGETSKFLKCP